jgi:hypothetical protein
MIKAKTVKRVLLAIEIALFVTGFVVGSLGTTPLLRSWLTPAAYSAQKSFHLLLQGRPVSADSKGFPIFERALNIYAQEHDWRFPSGRMNKGYLRPREIQNSQSMINSTAVLNFSLVNGAFLHVSLPEYQAIVDSLVNQSTLPFAVVMFVAALCLRLAQHYFDVERPNKCFQPIGDPGSPQAEA